MAVGPDRGWEETLRRLGAGVGQLDRFVSSLPPGYAEATSPEQAARDWAELAALVGYGAGGGKGSNRAPTLVSPGAIEGRFFVAEAGAGAGFRLRRAGSSRVALSHLVPALESFGLAVVEAVPWHFTSLGPGGQTLYLDDIGVQLPGGSSVSGFEARAGEERFVGALHAVLAGLTEQSRLNYLVVSAGLDWRQVNLLSAYRSYRQVAGGPKAAEKAETLVESLVQYPEAASALLALFEELLCRAGGAAQGAHAGAPPKADEARHRAEAALSEVPDLAHFDALQDLLALVLATVRSNWELATEAVSFKIASPEVGFLPLPRPHAEVFVWAPWFIGAHLRFGPVARGGIRWSDRHDDLRSEILGLARAQVKKNSLIVPTGAKGGFVLRPPAAPDDETLGREAYKSFIGALLDLTDNVVDGVVRHPAGVVCRDGDDPYLVVAPDKGTASFSDLANEVAVERGFWLGDAFASGGSHGYDHKALGITAKGAWLAVRRHFRALGMDAQRDSIRVAGVGDMSGDVFGNGMLQSSAIKLVAAFDHRHVFVDPDPDEASSFVERRRLQELAHSSWGDYDLSGASSGAAVYSRQDKKIELSAEASAALGVAPGLLTPPELVRAVLRAPVDLIYFGGVGTFVKASDEADSLVDDADNDEVRVGAGELRARVVAEGANLALTQRARVAYARRGGRVNADFVDNAAGVAMSDREVNTKILLGLGGEKGLLTPGEREELLAKARDAAARAVLADVAGNLVALDVAAASSARDLDAWAALADDLEQSGLLDREVESLPGPEELAKRRDAGAGFSRPELAVLVAYARSELARSIERSALVSDESLLPLAVAYFPAPLGERLRALVPAHALFRQVVSSQLANEVVSTMGGLWAHEVAAEGGFAPWEAAAAYWAAHEVLKLGPLRAGLDEHVWDVGVDAEMGLRAALADAAGRLARWYLARGLERRLAEVVERDGPLVGSLASFGQPSALSSAGVPPGLADAVAAVQAQAAIGELGEVARATGGSIAQVAASMKFVEASLGLDALGGAFASWEPPGRWQRWQLHMLADDLALLRARATKAAIGPGPEQWLEERRDFAQRSKDLATQARASKVPDLALGAVALRAAEVAVGAGERV
jgi:glutamate dehydrogenase